MDTVLIPFLLYWLAVFVFHILRLKEGEGKQTFGPADDKLSYVY